MTQQWDKWKTYRGAMIWRHLLKETTPDGRKKWMYFANVKDRIYPLYSRSQTGIKAQIGRCLNGLEPCDCQICVYHVKETPISPAHCGKDCKAYPIDTTSCEWFEVRS